ncbi:hypothetical protein [Paludibaculum fermentans]|uniref:Uncharacterized protein n=1 Tax=Paludibaculum fermentans TaxID=1473598 RepID=A0A7S7NUJ4_PALFE|nr:hypothetical protein [Paludibaculum fermentans]QOY90078.1 hypothetical protein IRI77_09025 [Paludibaculum fermentans]
MSAFNGKVTAGPATVMARSKHNLVSCPECTSGDVAVRQPRGVYDFLMELCGSYRFRCRNCQYKFRGNPVRFKDLFYAKCPGCLNQELSDARPDLVQTGTMMALRAALGANKHHCEHCGAVFASFRPVRGRSARSSTMVTRDARFNSEPPEIQPMTLPQPVLQAWGWVLDPPRLVVRLRIRIKPRRKTGDAPGLAERSSPGSSPSLLD